MPRSESDKSLIRDKLTASSTACALPWIHLHSTPEGAAAPCCISASCGTPTGMGDTKKQRLMELVNSPKMKQLRLDMLDGKRNDECVICYNQEDVGIISNRQTSFSAHPSAIDDICDFTSDDGSLEHFNMRYFDVRFSNICNFKCRSCGQEYSTQWEQENSRANVSYAREIAKNNNKEFLQDILDQIPNMEIAYFAGGEPLITDQHYIILEEMIRQKKTDVILRYNTNLSNLKFKNKDLLELWRHFDHNIQLSASIDHVKERAEYIRHGTDWGAIESNFLLVKQQPNITVQINTVLTLFNYLTIDQFYGYLIDNGMYTAWDDIYQLYNTAHPKHISVRTLPVEYKQRGKESVARAINIMRENCFNDGLNRGHFAQLENTNLWVDGEHNWEEEKESFKNEINRVDLLRGEDFRKTFPELAPLLDL
jgi:MoaA/NifB/PqqE/SkfB family radical SAM enzyme